MQHFLFFVSIAAVCVFGAAPEERDEPLVSNELEGEDPHAWYLVSGETSTLVPPENAESETTTLTINTLTVSIPNIDDFPLSPIADGERAPRSWEDTNASMRRFRGGIDERIDAMFERVGISWVIFVAALAILIQLSQWMSSGSPDV